MYPGIQIMEQDLAEALIIAKVKAYGDRLRRIMSSIIQESLGCADGRRIIAITVTRRHTYMAQNLLRSFSASAEVLESQTKKDKRLDIVKKLQISMIQVLVNIGLERHFLWVSLTVVIIACQIHCTLMQTALMTFAL